MKIGILTFHFAHNYGAVLQAYALLSKLKEMGHDAYIINRHPDVANISRWIYHHIAYKHVWGWLKFDRSVRKMLQPQTRLYTTQKAIRKHFSENGFDAVVVGSDQVWRWNWRMSGLNYYLDFLADDDKMRKVAYAASFGVSEWKSSEQDTSQVKTLLEKFSAISVRETAGVEICRNVFQINAQLVLDPTLLYDSSFYEEHFHLSEIHATNPKVVSIMLSQPHLSVQQMMWAKQKGMLHVDLSNTFYECRQLRNHTEFHWQHVTVKKWLEEIRSAHYVITNSFHATVFCLLFGKPFVTLNLAKGGASRIETLLGYVRLEYRLVKDLKEAEVMIDCPIDYEKVWKRLKELRGKSLEFLKAAFER